MLRDRQRRAKREACAKTAAAAVAALRAPATHKPHDPPLRVCRTARHSSQPVAHPLSMNQLGGTDLRHQAHINRQVDGGIVYNRADGATTLYPESI